MIVIVLVVLIKVTPSIVRYIEPKTMRMKKIRMNIRYEGDSKELIQFLKTNGIILRKIRIKDSEKDSQQHTLTVTAMIKDDTYITDVYDTIRKKEKVVALDIEGI